MSVIVLSKTRSTSWITSMAKNVSLSLDNNSIFMYSFDYWLSFSCSLIKNETSNFFFLPKSHTDQRNLGMSMKIERSSLDQVKKRFEINKKKMEEKKKEYDFEERLKELKEEVFY